MLVKGAPEDNFANTSAANNRNDIENYICTNASLKSISAPNLMS